MLIIKGDKKYLNLDLITKTIEELSAEVGQVFKGVLVQRGRPRVLSLFTLNSVPELEKLYAIAAEAIRFEKERQDQSKSQLDSAFSHIEDLETSQKANSTARFLISKILSRYTNNRDA